MSEFGLMPAEQLGAVYNPANGILMLNAKVPGYVVNVKFISEKWFGGYKFSLRGMEGPLTDPTRPTHGYQQSFPMHLLPGTKNIIIADSNNPQGTLVEIYYLGLIPPSSITPPYENNNSQDVLQSFSSMQQEKTIYAKLNESFYLTQAIDLVTFGLIHIDFDPEYITLAGANVDSFIQPQMEWVLKGVKEGTTIVTVTLHGKMAGFIRNIPYSVVIS